MAKKKPIKLYKGRVKDLALACKVSTVTVWEALHWRRDTEQQALIRKRAEELGFIKRF